MKTSQKQILSQYSKEQLITLYDLQKGFRRLASFLKCDPATLSGVFKTLNISIKKFPKGNKILSDVTKETLEKELKEYTIKEVAAIHDVHPGQLVARMKELDIPRSRKNPHRRNQAMLSLPDPLFKEMVEYRGVLDAAKELNCSQSAIRDRANRLGVILVAGPHKALTLTPKWRELQRQNGLRTSTEGPNKNTSIEIALQEYLKLNNVNFELHPKIINLTVPDAFVAPNFCIYADGCYWHGCSTCKVAVFKGLSYVASHDKFVNSELAKAGYKVIRIWEHDIKNGDFTSLAPLLKK